MNKKYGLIIIGIVIVLVVATIIVTNFQIGEEIEYKSLQLSDTCAVSVPMTNNSTFTDEDGLKTYNDTDLRIISYNKNDLGEWENIGANIGVNGALNQNFKYNHSHHGKNILIHPDDNETTYACLISNDTTGDVIIVITQNEELLYHIIDNVNFTINKTNNASDVNENIVESGYNSVKYTNEKSTDESEYREGYIAENDQDFDYDGDGVGDGSAYHSHEYYVERGQTEPVTPNSG